MGYYGINQARIQRETIKGERVIVVSIFIEDIGPAGTWQTKQFTGVGIPAEGDGVGRVSTHATQHVTE